MVKPTILYRIASVLIALFAVGHIIGFRKTDPQWGVDATVAAMRSVHFQNQGFNRTYWDFFVGFGLFASIFLLLAAVFAWHLAGLPASALALMRTPAWALALCFVAVTILNWRYFFLAPVIFSGVIALCLLAAAWLSPNRV